MAAICAAAMFWVICISIRPAVWAWIMPPRSNSTNGLVKGGYENACTNLEETKAEMAQGTTSDRDSRLNQLSESCALENEAACQAFNAGNATLSVTLRPSEDCFFRRPLIHIF